MIRFHDGDRKRPFLELTSQKSDEAEGVRFELTRPFGLPVFKTGAINRSATPPRCAFAIANLLLHYYITPSEITQRSGNGATER